MYVCVRARACVRACVRAYVMGGGGWCGVGWGWGGVGVGVGEGWGLGVGGWGSYGGGYLDATFLSYENKNKIDTVWRHLAPDAGTPVCCFSIRDLGLYSRSGKASYRHIWWGLEVMRLDFILIVSLWYLKASNFRAIAKYKPESLSFETSRDLAVWRSST